MNKISKKKLEKLEGGATTSISGPVINAFCNIIKMLFDAGSEVGSSMRRIGENKMCSLD